jgi:hypothetical protein
VYREMLRAAGPAVPAPSLSGIYGALRGLGALGHAGVDATSQGLANRAAHRPFFGKGTGLAAATGVLTGLGTEFQRTIDSLSWLVGLAVFLTWWGPYLLGLANLVLLGLFRS